MFSFPNLRGQLNWAEGYALPKLIQAFTLSSMESVLLSWAGAKGGRGSRLRSYT